MGSEAALTSVHHLSVPGVVRFSLLVSDMLTATYWQVPCF